MMKTKCVAGGIIAVVVSLILQECSRPPIVFPQGFSKTIELKTESIGEECVVPIAFTEQLIFPSKYAGSDEARDELNQISQARYQAMASLIYDFSADIAKLSSRLYQNEGSVHDYRCYLQKLSAWANERALLADANNTGKAVRKWTLALLSSHYLKLQSVHESHNSSELISQRAVITNWLNELAETVINDYQETTEKKINNHYYWAAWAVMVTSAVTQSRSQYQWAQSQYQFAIQQINEEGMWPNELKRATRAHQYHNFAIAPIIAMTSILKRNGDLKQGMSPRLKLLARNVLIGIESTLLFASITGEKQVEYSITKNGRLAWLPIYFALTDDPLAKTILESYQPSGFTRLGGETKLLFL